jgi:hypothetical protein
VCRGPDDMTIDVMDFAEPASSTPEPAIELLLTVYGTTYSY